MHLVLSRDSLSSERHRVDVDGLRSGVARRDGGAAPRDKLGVGKNGAAVQRGLGTNGGAAQRGLGMTGATSCRGDTQGAAR